MQSGVNNGRNWAVADCLTGWLAESWRGSSAASFSPVVVKSRDGDNINSLRAPYLLGDVVRPMLLSSRIPACEGGISGLKFLFASKWDTITRYIRDAPKAHVA